jgi:uncharacterized DUF497 family protein
VAELRFEWDERKNAQDRQKHGLTFEEAKTAFYDDRALLIPDPDHSDDEDRFILMGLSSASRVLVVCHVYREGNDTIRIISARKANGTERADYEGRWSR